MPITPKRGPFCMPIHIDGVALKAMVDAWVAASEAEKPKLFEATLAVRQIEIGLASILSLLFGLTALIYGIALLIDGRFAQWIGVMAIFGGIFTAASGGMMAQIGFSEPAMSVNMSASSLLLLWMIVLGIAVWRSDL